MNSFLKCTLLAGSFLTFNPLVFAQPSVSAPEAALEIRVRTYNHAQVPDKLLADAKRHATYAFQRIGVNLSWMDCPLREEDIEHYSDCHRPWESTDLFIKIISSSKGFVVPSNAFGLAVLPEDGEDRVRAYVFYDPVLKLSTDYRVGASLVLGHVAAHEIGHLLLGSNGHSPFGIMTASWQGTELKKAAQGGMLFNRMQAERIRTEVQARQSRSTANAWIKAQRELGVKKPE